MAAQSVAVILILATGTVRLTITAPTHEALQAASPACVHHIFGTSREMPILL
jgi:hypothetical protein